MKKKLFIIVIACTMAVAVFGCGKATETQEASEEATVEATVDEATTEAAQDVSAYNPDSFDSSEVRIEPDHEMTADISGCDTFTQIVGKAENAGMAYTNTDIGDTNVLLMASGTYQYDEETYAAIDAEIFKYGDEAPAYVGFVEAGGTAYPLGICDGYLYACGNHFCLKYTMKDGELMLSEEAYVSYDGDGNGTYYYKTNDTQYGDYTEDEAQGKYDDILNEYLEGAEILNFDTIGGVQADSSSLPKYAYPGDDPVLSAVCDYLVNEIGANYDAADVTIPYISVVDIDESDESDIRVWGDFWIDNYDLEGDVLMSRSGGAYPGLMHLVKNDDGTYSVTEFEPVADGSDYTASAKKIFGDKYDEFSKINSDETARKNVRVEYIRGYVDENDLNITAYQDYGWDPVELY